MIENEYEYENEYENEYEYEYEYESESMHYLSKITKGLPIYSYY
jgi:hypothetical protein